MHTSGVAATVTVMMKTERVLLMWVYRGQRASGGITGVYTNPEMQGAVLRRVTR